MSDICKTKPLHSRLTCTYAEAIYLIHQKGYDLALLHEKDIDPAAGIIAYIFGRDPAEVKDHIMKGLP